MGSGSTRGDESDSSRAMSKTFRPWDVEQRWLLPPSVHELVPAGHVAHFVRDTVREELDLSVIFAAYDEERGYPPYHPTMMVSLLLYAYSRGRYSSRRIAQACEERVDFMAVTAMNQPDFRTIAKFRLVLLSQKAAGHGLEESTMERDWDTGQAGVRGWKANRRTAVRHDLAPTSRGLSA